MTRKILTSIAVMALLAGCSASRERNLARTASSSPEAGSSPAAASPTTRAPTSIELPWLPPQGVVVERNGGVAFVSMDGRVLVTLPDLDLANPTEAPGPIVLREEHAWFALDVGLHRLRRIGRVRADALRTLDDPAIDLPVPATSVVNGEPAGHRRFAMLSPAGDRILAQWSGECEVPTAYVVTIQDGAPVPITGAGSEMMASLALGWTRRGRALAVLPYGACRTGAETPGVYAFDASGVASLITTVPPSGWARMWGRPNGEPP